MFFIFCVMNGCKIANRVGVTMSHVTSRFLARGNRHCPNGCVRNEPNGYLCVAETFGAAKPTRKSIQKSKQPKRNLVPKAHLYVISGDIAVGYIFNLIEALVFPAYLKHITLFD